MISYVIAAHNSEAIIEDSVLRVVNFLRSRNSAFEVIVIENGSIDHTSDILTKLTQEIAELRIDTSSVGLGHAFRKGILLSRGNLVIANADDLPFGFSELKNILERSEIPQVAIGSKAHKESQLERSLGRTISSAGLRLMRLVVLGLAIGDTQGTYVMEGDTARDLAQAATEGGYIFTTEIAYLAKKRGITIEEIPVQMDASLRPSTVRVLRHSWQMFAGMIRIKNKHKLV